MAKSVVWKHSRSPYEIFELVTRNPRITQREISRKFNINLKTAFTWWSHAIDRRIIIPPVFRRKSYSNFREYFYFLNVDDPHILYNNLKEDKKISYISIESGFANFFVISQQPITPEGDVRLKGFRSDYYVSIPPDQPFETAISKIQKKLENVDRVEDSPSPLVQREYPFEPWDEKDEAIFQSICNDVRKPFSHVLRETSMYSDKVFKWFKRRNEFGQIFSMFFPEGDSSYVLMRYLVETKMDSLLIDIFSEFPTSTTFCRVSDKLVIALYLPFSVEGRKIVREILSFLKRRELVDGYTNSFVEYYYRRD